MRKSNYQKSLTRDDFREKTFERDNHKCVICGEPAQDAHHIIERRLWGESQGYFIDNGASVCGEHHLACEMTTISVEEVRRACGITKIIVPEHLYADHKYDKWGNHVLANGTRTKGELFFDESVKKIMNKGGVLNLFTDYIKYPRTPHVPWSDSISDDDRIIKSMNAFKDAEIIITEKMDGENTTMYNDHIHARSVDGKSHPSQSYVKNYWANMSYNIPDGFRICGENLYAVKNIAYSDLSIYFQGFSVWNTHDNNTCLSWDDTIEWFEMLEIEPVKVLYRGKFDVEMLKKFHKTMDLTTSEGYIVRTADSFQYGQFNTHTMKYVRENHITNNNHWSPNTQFDKNKIGESK